MTRSLVNPLLIHIGYHKTGTTWLQTGIFADQSSGFIRICDSHTIRQHVVFPSAFEFNPDTARDEFHRLIPQTPESSAAFVISDERLSGSPHSGGYDSAEIAERLSAIFPDAKILIVIREQAAAIYSLYQQYVRDGGCAPLKHYLSPRNPAEVPQFRFSHLEYHHLIEHYYDLFGRQNILVLPYEWLKADPIDFATRICEFIALKGSMDFSMNGRRYSSLNALTIELKRRANLVLVRNSLNPSGRFHVKNHERYFERLNRVIPRTLSSGLEHRQKDYIHKMTVNRYDISNNKTTKLIDVDLQSLGYSVTR